MKIFTTFFLALIPFITLSQHNFKIENNRANWHKVANNDLSITDYYKELKSSGNFKNLELYDDEILGELEERPVDYGALGHSRGSTTMILLMSNLTGKVRFQFKDGRVRTSVNNINLIKNIDAVKYAQDKTTMEDFSIKKGEFRKRVLKKDLNILHTHIYNMLNIDNGDW